MTEPLPHGARIWDNQARRSLSKGHYCWLAVLVGTCLSSVFFVWDQVPPRWLLAGFILSHLIVFLAPSLLKITLRIGIVGLLHIICWGPGWGLILHATTQGNDLGYFTWLCVTAAVIAQSFFYDARDGIGYLRWKYRNVRS